jgi:hypothetical protein
MCFHCSQRGTLQSWMNFMWEDLEFDAAFFSQLRHSYSKDPQGREAMSASCQHANLSPFLSLQPV